MKNKRKKGVFNGGSREVSESEKEIAKLLRQIEGHGARGIGLLRNIHKKLGSIDTSIDIFAAQKMRELNPDEPPVEETS